MNSKVIIGLIGSFVGGAFAGIAGTYIYMKKSYCDKKIDEGIQDYILHRYDVETGEVKEESDREDGEESSEGHHDISSTTVPKYQTPYEDRTHYDEFFEKKSPQEVLAEREHPLDSDEDDEDNDILNEMGEGEREAYLEGLSKSEEHAAYVRGEMDPVEIIDEDDYGSEYDYDDDVLIYWLGDDILTTETEEMVFDELKDGLVDIFTDSWKESAEKNPEDEGSRLYVRHHEFMKDYMIVPDARAYFECH